MAPPSRMRPAVLAVALAAALAGCATAGSAAKGGLVPLDLPADALAAARAPRRLAVLVGIQSFEDGRWRPLRYPHADAAALAEVLRDPELGAFDEVRVVEDATREGLRAALADLARLDRDERDTVVVYLSTHGSLARDRAGALRRYVVAKDTRFDDVPGTGLSMDELRAAFDALASRRKVLVLATCHSGAGKSLLPPEIQAELEGTKDGFLARPLEEVSRASVVLAASDWGETAREDARLGHDVYTYYLVEALRAGSAADRNGDGAVTASEAHDHARRRTWAFTGGTQRPSAETSEVGADPIVLAGKVSRRGRPELWSYAPRLDGFTVKVNGEVAGELPGGVAVPPGRHRVQLAKGDGPALVDRDVDLAPGERLELESLLRRRAGRLEVAPRAALLGFLDGRSRREVLGVVPGAGLAVTISGWPAPRLAVRLDGVTASGRGRLDVDGRSAGFDYQVITAGLALPYRLVADGRRGAAIVAGPRLSAVWVERSFDGALAGPRQRLVTFAPGLLVGASAPIGRRLTAGVELQLDWTLVRVDGEDRSTGFAQVMAGIGWRFW